MKKVNMDWNVSTGRSWDICCLNLFSLNEKAANFTANWGLSVALTSKQHLEGGNKKRRRSSVCQICPHSEG